MTKLNQIGFLWYFKDFDIKVINTLVISALDRWDRKKDLEEYIPEIIAFNPEYIEKLSGVVSIEKLSIEFDNTVPKGHFMIKGER